MIEVYRNPILIHNPHTIFKHFKDSDKIAMFYNPSHTQQEFSGFITKEKKEQIIKDNNLVKVDYFPETMNNELSKLISEVNV